MLENIYTRGQRHGYMLPKIKNGDVIAFRAVPVCWVRDKSV